MYRLELNDFYINKLKEKEIILKPFFLRDGRESATEKGFPNCLAVCSVFSFKIVLLKKTLKCTWIFFEYSETMLPDYLEP